MWNKEEVTLIYECLTKNENKSPITIKMERIAKCDDIGQFSNNYYNNRQRTMRGSNNLRINEYHIKDITEDGNVYELKYVKYKGNKYQVINILNDKITRSKVILDIQMLNRQ